MDIGCLAWYHSNPNNEHENNVLYEWHRCTASAVHSTHADYISSPVHQVCPPTG